MQLRPRLHLRSYGAAPGSHSHAHYQVLWGWQGAMEIEIEGRGARIDAGRVAVIGPGERHDFSAPRGARCFVIDCDDAALEPYAGAVLACESSLGYLMQYLDAAPDMPPAATELMLHSLTRASAARQATGARPIRWDALDAWIDAHLAEPIDVERLAAQVHLSASQFAARCVRERGIAPLALVRGRRLAAARRWRDAGASVADTAARCGYRSPSALTAALRRSG